MDLQKNGDGATGITTGLRTGLPSCRRSRWLCGLLLAALSASTQAGIYKWTDDEGRVHYTQSPPPTGTTSADINSDTFSTIRMNQVQTRSISTKRAKPSTRKRPTRVRSRCRRR